MLPKLNPELDAFVDKHINTFTKWDLVVLFHHHYGMLDTPDAIATRLGRRRDDVVPALDELVDSGILSRQQAGERMTAYGYVSNGEHDALVSEFVGALDSREKRLQILTKLLRLGARE